MPVIDIFALLLFRAGFLIEVEGLIYFVHPICGGLSGVFPVWCLHLSIVTHELCLLIGGRTLLGIFQRYRRLVLTLCFLSGVFVVPLSRPIYVEYLAPFLLQDVGPPSLLYGEMWILVLQFCSKGPFGEENIFQSQFSS